MLKTLHCLPLIEIINKIDFVLLCRPFTNPKKLDNTLEEREKQKKHNSVCLLALGERKNPPNIVEHLCSVQVVQDKKFNINLREHFEVCARGLDLELCLFRSILNLVSIILNRGAHQPIVSARGNVEDNGSRALAHEQTNNRE